MILSRVSALRCGFLSVAWVVQSIASDPLSERNMTLVRIAQINELLLVVPVQESTTLLTQGFLSKNVIIKELAVAADNLFSWYSGFSLLQAEREKEERVCETVGMLDGIYSSYMLPLIRYVDSVQGRQFLPSKHEQNRLLLQQTYERFRILIQKHDTTVSTLKSLCCDFEFHCGNILGDIKKISAGFDKVEVSRKLVEMCAILRKQLT